MKKFRNIPLLAALTILCLSCATSAVAAKSNLEVRGKVCEPGGKGISGIRVTDGYSIVLTDDKGNYTMDSNPEKSRFISITVPAEYEIPTHSDGHPLFYREMPRKAKGDVADFVLKKRETTVDKYTLLVLGDIQISRIKNEQRIKRLRNKIVPDLLDFIDSSGQPCFAISVGDLLSGDMSVYEDYRREMKRLDIPVFNLVGNHDHNPLLSGDVETVREYESNFGPSNYSFDIGQIHFVMLDNVIYRTKDDYTRGLTDDILEWLHKDLSYVEKGSTVILGMHIPMDTNEQRNADTRFYNHQNLLTLLQDYKVHVFCGHRHAADMYNYPAPYDNIVIHQCPRTGGNHKMNSRYCNDGTPSGYMVFEVDGTDTEWYHKREGHKDTDVQMSLLSPTEIGNSNLFANIWYWDSKWGPVEWWENGVKVAEMEHFPRVDTNFNNEHLKIYNKPSKDKSWHMFRTKPTPGVTSGVVKVTDRFGNIREQKISW